MFVQMGGMKVISQAFVSIVKSAVLFVQGLPLKTVLLVALIPTTLHWFSTRFSLLMNVLSAAPLDTGKEK